MARITQSSLDKRAKRVARMKLKQQIDKLNGELLTISDPLKREEKKLEVAKLKYQRQQSK